MMNKTIRNIFLLLLLTMSLLVGCSPALIQSEITATLPAEEIAVPPSETPTEAVPPTPTPTPLPLDGQQTQYFIDATIDYYNRFITASSRSVYTNKTEIAINEIVYVFYPTIFPGSFYIRSVTAGDGTPVTNNYWDGHRMVIPLEEPLLPGDQIEFIHDYELVMPERGGVFSHSGNQLNLSYWYPFIPPYDEIEGWLAHGPQFVNSDFVGEFMVFESADHDVSIQFSDRRENFKIAAGAVPQETDGVIRYQLDLARTFVLSISDSFVVAEREINGVKIQSFAFFGHESIAEVVADVAVDSISLFSELFGSYERELMTVVEFNADIGMEFDGIIFLSPAFYNLYPGTPKSNIHIYTAHEVAHQWFFSLVGNDQALEPWLDEALATYSELLFYERYYPDILPWWWENYILYHQPSGFIDISIYFGDGLHEYRNIVYRNGALFIHDLRATLGDELFFDFLKTYVHEHRYSIATGESFWSLLYEHTDADLTPLINKYFSESPLNP